MCVCIGVWNDNCVLQAKDMFHSERQRSLATQGTYLQTQHCPDGPHKTTDCTQPCRAHGSWLRHVSMSTACAQACRDTRQHWAQSQIPVSQFASPASARISASIARPTSMHQSRSRWRRHTLATHGLALDVLSVLALEAATPTRGRYQQHAARTARRNSCRRPRARTPS